MSLYWIRFVCVCVCLCAYFCAATAQIGRMSSRWGFLITHTHTHTHTHISGTTPLIEWSASRKSRYLHSIQETQATNISAASGIWTRDLSNHVAADLRLRQHYHWALLKEEVCNKNIRLFTDLFIRVIHTHAHTHDRSLQWIGFMKAFTYGTENLVRTSQRTKSLSILKTSRLILCSGNNTKHISVLCDEVRSCLTSQQVVHIQGGSNMTGTNCV
jgi:hypothetical protein